MIISDNIPQCPCGTCIFYWESQVTHAAFLNKCFDLTCPDCNKKLTIRIRDKMVFETSWEGCWDIPAAIDKEVTAWTYLGKRGDGTFYVASLFPTKDAVIRFIDDGKWNAVGIAEFKGTFKLLPHELNKK